jgi:hypothetical protein
MLEGCHGPHPHRSPAIATRLAARLQRWLRTVGPLALGALLLVSGLTYWIWIQGAERRAVVALPTAERRQLFERTLENLRFCRDHAAEDSFRGYCEQQADLAVGFPECDASCSKLARLPWSGPHR